MVGRADHHKEGEMHVGVLIIFIHVSAVASSIIVQPVTLVFLLCIRFFLCGSSHSLALLSPWCSSKQILSLTFQWAVIHKCSDHVNLLSLIRT